MSLNFLETKIAGAYLIEPRRAIDQRGFFARTWCQREFAERGLEILWPQANVSYNELRGTLRGLHYQAAPHGETKLVRCTRGAIHDVILDLRPSSETFGRFDAFELSADNYRELYIPQGLAHGFMTLCDATEVFYQMSNFFRPEAARGVRYNDPTFAIHWPSEPAVISDRDAEFPLWPAVAAMA